MPELTGKPRTHANNLNARHNVGADMNESEILQDLKLLISSGKSLEQAAKDVAATKKYDHLSVRRTADKLARDLAKLKSWKQGSQ